MLEDAGEMDGKDEPFLPGLRPHSFEILHAGNERNEDGDSKDFASHLDVPKIRVKQLGIYSTFAHVL